MIPEEEIFPLVDEQGKVTGQASRSRCHDGSKLLHPVVHLHLFNSKGELFLQKRSAKKDIQPNLWDTSSAGHIDIGELPHEAVVREAREELGVIDIDPRFIWSYIIESDRERELSYCYYAIYDGDIKIDHDEVEDGRFFSIHDIQKQIGQGIFTLNFESDFIHFLDKGLDALKQITWKTDNFDTLTNDALYQIFDIRNRVFYLEQKVSAPDFDYKDQKALHLQGYIGNVLIAYCRIFLPDKTSNTASIGRVAVLAEHRKCGYGRNMIEKAINIIEDHPIFISAQIYLLNFYKSLGFSPIGESYIEAGIRHIHMCKN